MKALITGFLLLAALAFTGCKNKASLDDNGMPKTLIIGAVQTESFDQIKEAREQIRKYLEKKLGMHVEMLFTTDYNGLIEALKSNKIHMANIPPFAYIIATRTMQLTPLITLGNSGKPSTYQSVIIVNAHSNIKSMADVKARSKSLSFAFVDPASTSGHLIPRAYLNTIGLNPDTAFKQTLFAGSHPAAVLSVKSGKVDVACTTSSVFKIMEKANMIKESDIRIIWTSDPIVSDPIVIRTDINKQFAKKVQKAYLDMNTEAPELLNNYVKLYLKDTAKRSYMVATDSMYDGLRKIAAGVKDLKLN